jgi:hypothetical protein
VHLCLHACKPARDWIGSYANSSTMANLNPPPTQTINALCFCNSLLSEEELLICLLAKPVIKIGNHSYSRSEAGTKPSYDPELIRNVPLAEFLEAGMKHFTAVTTVFRTLCLLLIGKILSLVRATIGPISKTSRCAYLSLSRVLRPKRIMFGQDNIVHSFNDAKVPKIPS